jgi:hypothetical protein
MKAPASLEMLDAEVQIDDQRHMQHAVLALLTLAALEVDGVSENPNTGFEILLNGEQAIFQVSDVLVENNRVQLIIATAGDRSREGDIPMRAILISDNQPVQKLFIYDGGIVLLGSISIAAFTNLLEGA